MKDIIIKTVALSRKRDASVRYWLGAGVGMHKGFRYAVGGK
jgi:hypothetical protein